MSPGNVPMFGPSLHTPHADLNEVMRQLGPLLNLQAMPPIYVERTPAGVLLRLNEAPSSDSKFPDPLRYRMYTYPSTTFHSGAEPLRLWDFQVPETGYYLMTGQLTARINRTAAQPSVVHFFTARLDWLATGTTDEVQSLGASGATSGTFTLTFNSQTTLSIAWNARADQVRTALEFLSNINSGDVACDGGPLPEIPIRIRFRYGGTYGGQPQSLITSTDSLIGGATSITRVTAGSATTQGKADVLLDEPIFNSTIPSWPPFQVIPSGFSGEVWAVAPLRHFVRVTESGARMSVLYGQQGTVDPFNPISIGFRQDLMHVDTFRLGD